MSLMKLLVMGRSINESRDLRHRYRLSGRSHLPKFSLASKQTAVNAELVSVVSQLPVAAPSEEVESGADGSAKLPLPEPRCCPAVATKRSKVTWLPRFGWKRLLMLIQAFNSKLMKRVSRPQSSLAKPSQLQTELSLDAVRVIRNDLNDADLEVVVVGKTKPAPDLTNSEKRNQEIDLTSARQVKTPVGHQSAIRLLAAFCV